MTRTIDSSSNNSHFLSYDIGLASALTTLHFELLSLNRDNPRKIGFIFLRSPELDQSVQEYFAGRLSIDARSFFENIKMLKNRIFGLSKLLRWFFMVVLKRGSERLRFFFCSV